MVFHAYVLAYGRPDVTSYPKNTNMNYNCGSSDVVERQGEHSCRYVDSFCEISTSWTQWCLAHSVSYLSCNLWECSLQLPYTRGFLGFGIVVVVIIVVVVNGVAVQTRIKEPILTLEPDMQTAQRSTSSASSTFAASVAYTSCRSSLVQSSSSSVVGPVPLKGSCIASVAMNCGESCP